MKTVVEEIMMKSGLKVRKAATDRLKSQTGIKRTLIFSPAVDLLLRNWGAFSLISYREGQKAFSCCLKSP